MSAARPVREGAKRVVIGVGGGIAAYKSCHLVRLFTEAGHDVTVIPTEAALRFVGSATWEALSGKPVHTLWDQVSAVPHVSIGQEADLVVVAPATADLIARAAHGLADDLLTTTLLMATAPILMAPAMHTEMWLHAATQANVATLRSRGIHVLDPAVGRLTGVDSGPGRLPEPELIFAAALRAAETTITRDLAGRRIVVSAGGTREPIDPVRFLGNRSSGRQGYAIAAAAARRGGDVTLVSANVALEAPIGVTVRSVETAAELHEAMHAEALSADVIVMAAAVADYRPSDVAIDKIKKSDVDPVLTLIKNEDTLSSLVKHRADGQVIVGFAAETGSTQESSLDMARAKLQRKGCDLLVFNDVSGGAVFNADTTNAVLLDAAGTEEDLGAVSKDTLADALLDRVVLRLP
jgi:phosphopantothenoylcysteine decarboxylase/phosphopantothenate--cysteine ligase